MLFNGFIFKKVNVKVTCFLNLHANIIFLKLGKCPQSISAWVKKSKFLISSRVAYLNFQTYCNLQNRSDFVKSDRFR